LHADRGDLSGCGDREGYSRAAGFLEPDEPHLLGGTLHLLAGIGAAAARAVQSLRLLLGHAGVARPEDAREVHVRGTGIFQHLVVRQRADEIGFQPLHQQVAIEAQDQLPKLSKWAIVKPWTAGASTKPLVAHGSCSKSASALSGCRTSEQAPNT